jgi:hypothetical protein
MEKTTIKCSFLAIRLILFTPVLLLLLFGAYLSFRWALADVLVTQVRHQLEKTQIEGQSLDAKQWRLTRNWLDPTLRLHADYSA